MSASRLPDYLDHMRQAIADAQSFVDGMAQADFMQDIDPAGIIHEAA